MYQWYRNSSVFYAYLGDVDHESISELRKSRWFTRGWTLQELIAPRTIEFYTADSVEHGTRLSVKEELADITGINILVLQGGDLWAARRTTTRVEDEAYSLMGLFGVNMPLLYG
jgi:hypothetical protein